MIEIDDEALRRAINEVAATDSGKIVFAAIKEECQWDATYLSSQDLQTTQFFAVKRGVYGGIRQHIKIQHLKEIEFNYKRKTKNGRDVESGTTNNAGNPSSRAKLRGSRGVQGQGLGGEDKIKR